MKFKMAATAGLSLTLNPMGKMVQNASSEWSLEGPLQNICFLWRFETFLPIGSNVKLSPAVAAILNFISKQKT
jgi:hypothetical protein